MARSSWIGDYNDPNTFLDMWVTGGGNNRCGWSDGRYDALIADAAQGIRSATNASTSSGGRRKCSISEGNADLSAVLLCRHPALRREPPRRRARPICSTSIRSVKCTGSNERVADLPSRGSAQHGLSRLPRLPDVHRVDAGALPLIGRLPAGAGVRILGYALCCAVPAAGGRQPDDRLRRALSARRSPPAGAARISSRSARICSPASRPAGSTAAERMREVVHRSRAWNTPSGRRWISGKGVVLVISHMGNWELFAPLCQVLPEYQWSCTVYQPLGNRFIEAHVQQAAQPRCTLMFNRKQRVQRADHLPAGRRSGGRAGRPTRGRPRRVDTVCSGGWRPRPRWPGCWPCAPRRSWCRWPCIPTGRRGGSWSFPRPCRAWRQTARPGDRGAHRAAQPAARTPDQPPPGGLVLGAQPLENAEAEISARHVPAGHRPAAGSARRRR